jgi:hypothetical protein
MKKFRLALTADGSVTLEIEAETKAQAFKLGRENARLLGFCHRWAYNLRIQDVTEQVN